MYLCELLNRIKENQHIVMFTKNKKDKYDNLNYDFNVFCEYDIKVQNISCLWNTIFLHCDVDENIALFCAKNKSKQNDKIVF